MKLYRFVAPDNHQAMLKIHSVLGPDAFVYATSQVPEGVEMLAGFPHVEEGEGISEEKLYIEPPIENAVQIKEEINPENKLIENLNAQLHNIEQNIQKLSFNISSLYQVVVETHEKKKKNSGWNFLKFIRPRKKNQEGIYGK